MNDDALSSELMEMLEAKKELVKSIFDLMESGDRQRLIETVIENAVHDIQFMINFDRASEHESTKLFDVQKAEMLKLMLFDFAGIGNPNS